MGIIGARLIPLWPHESIEKGPYSSWISCKFFPGTLILERVSPDEAKYQRHLLQLQPRDMGQWGQRWWHPDQAFLPLRITVLPDSCFWAIGMSSILAHSQAWSSRKRVCFKRGRLVKNFRFQSEVKQDERCFLNLPTKRSLSRSVPCGRGVSGVWQVEKRRQWTCGDHHGSVWLRGKNTPRSHVRGSGPRASF